MTDTPYEDLPTAAQRARALLPLQDNPREPEFFDRELETAELNRRFGEVGSEAWFRVVLGPHKCGKSRVLRKVLMQNPVDVDFKQPAYKAAGAWFKDRLSRLKRRQGPQPEFQLTPASHRINRYRCLHIEFRGKVMQNDSHFVVVLSKAFKQMVHGYREAVRQVIETGNASLSTWAPSEFSIEGLMPAVTFTRVNTDAPSAATDLGNLMEEIELFFATVGDLRRTPGFTPIIWLDEVRLFEMFDETTLLRPFFDWLGKVSRQDNGIAVVMSSSESYFLEHIGKRGTELEQCNCGH